MRALLAAGFFFWLGALSPGQTFAADTAIRVRALAPSDAQPSPEAVASGSLDAQLQPFSKAPGHNNWRDYWLKLIPHEPASIDGAPVLIMNATRGLQAQLMAYRDGKVVPLIHAANLPAFLGARDMVFVVPEGVPPTQPLYAHLTSSSNEPQYLSVSEGALESTLTLGAERARMIALTFGALMSVSLAALLIWFVLKDPLFILYATMFSLQALYVAYLSGQGFDWPLLSSATPLESFAWNVPVGLSGAVACLFTREIADLRHFSPRVYTIFGWLAVAFVIITAANVAKFVGLLGAVNMIGNVMFVIAAAFTVIVCVLAWRRGNRAAGWFLIAWALLEGFTIAAALRFLITSSLGSDSLDYYGLPLSMVAASILIALGVADRLRAQRVALSDAERRAQTDPLTGVLNRRSLIERLDAACARAKARGLPIALLFIDLDHFKQINDTFGHQAGDACLCAIIEPIHAELRQSDVIGRYGGEEFVVILSSADAAAATPIAQRIVERVAAVRVTGFGEPISLTCSIGIASSDTLGIWGQPLLAQADAAVYVAKRSGRNQIHLAPPVLV
ncbi:MAG TPA: diguanylate cyclase [Steroidobacteraceae bacterium]|nr:diguanylate cyclase [Steroidobacteraceae bacterium]